MTNLKCNKCGYEYFRIRYERDGAVSVICDRITCGHTTEIQIVDVNKENLRRRFGSAVTPERRNS